MSEEGEKKQDEDFSISGDNFLFQMPGFPIRVGSSIAIFFAWIVFLIIWLFFVASDYNAFQNIAVILISIIVAIGLLAVLWVPWGLRYSSRLGQSAATMTKPKKIISASGVSGFAWLIFLIVWLFFYAGDYDIYQNLAIIIVSLLALGGINIAIWAVWGLRSCRK